MATETQTAEKIWTRDEIAEKISKDDRWALRAIVAIFEKQTADEKASEHTSHANGVGYSAYHAEFMSSLAKQAIRAHGRYGEYKLSEAQLKAGRKTILKYTRQLADIANGKM